MGTAKEIISALLPPENNPVKRWRLFVSAALLIGAFHVVWACGWLRYIGLGDGFALAATQYAVMSDVEEVKVLILQGDLKNAQKEYCLAYHNLDARGQTYWGNYIADAQVVYSTLTGRLYPLPPCPNQGATN